MKGFVLLLGCIFGFMYVSAQTIFRDLTFEEALNQAGVEGKCVLVDCYTSWCGPCKMMAEKILPLQEVGEYINGKFICVKFDMEKSEGLNIQQRYKVSSYPTFLILTSDGGVKARIVGAALDGKEFIKKIDASFTDNSVVNFEGEYLAGNRKMDFLLKYIKVLMDSGNAGKARDIALDVMTSLEDWQKCMEPYWFIYEDYQLSPGGSGNLTYFLKHVEQFRQGVGVEKVDKKLGSLFALPLESILRGANKNITLKEVDKLKSTLDTYNLTGQDYLYGYVDLIKGIMTGDTGMALKAYKRAFPFVPDEKIASLYFMPIMYFKEKWTGEQKKELIVLTDQLIQQVKMWELKASLSEMKADVLMK